MKKVLVCALAALFLMASCLTAFATPEYVTRTSYVKDGDVTSLYVKTTVTGAAADTMLTYLAYTGASATDESVVFIDQKTAEADTPVVFDYTTDDDYLTTNVTVKFGTSDTVEPYTKTESLSDSARVINVVVGEDSDSIVLPTNTTVGIYATDITVGDGYTVKTAVIGETDVASLIHLDGNVVKVEDAAALVNGATIVITLEAPYSYNPVVTETAAGHFNGFEGGIPAEKMTVFGKATSDFDKMEEGFDWGGMILSENAEFDIDTAGVQIFPAKYRGENGEFAVQLINKGDKELTTKTWYARVYVKSTTGIAYGEVKVFNPIVVDAE